jgi:hypothetical protein
MESHRSTWGGWTCHSQYFPQLKPVKTKSNML